MQWRYSVVIMFGHLLRYLRFDGQPREDAGFLLSPVTVLTRFGNPDPLHRRG